jgi:hypothetical protein
VREQRLHVSRWDMTCSALGASGRGDPALGAGAEAPRQSLGRDVQRSGCKRSWRHDYGCGGSSEGMRGATSEVSAHGMDWNKWLFDSRQ